VSDILIDPHAQAILTVMDAATMPDGAPIRIGDAVAPRSTDGKVVAPCAVLHIRPGGRVSGSLGCVNTDLLLRFSVVSVGKTAREARGVADRMNLALEGATAVVDDREVVRIGRPPDSSPIGSAQAEPQVPALFYVPVDYRLWTVPA
jgi:hypothetical protein